MVNKLAAEGEMLLTTETRRHGERLFQVKPLTHFFAFLRASVPPWLE